MNVYVYFRIIYLHLPVFMPVRNLVKVNCVGRSTQYNQSSEIRWLFKIFHLVKFTSQKFLLIKGRKTYTKIFFDFYTI